MEVRDPIWKLLVSEVRLAPAGDLKFPEGGWIELPRPWECDITPGETLILPEDEVSKTVKIPEIGMEVRDPIWKLLVSEVRLAPAGDLKFPEILLPSGTKIALPRDNKSLHLSEITKVPPGTTVSWPAPETEGKQTLVQTRRGPTFAWLPDGGSLVLTNGGMIRATPISRQAAVSASVLGF